MILAKQRVAASDGGAAAAEKLPSTHQTSSFESKHESFRPSVFERLKQAASSLMTPDEKPVKENKVESNPSSYEPLGSAGGASGDASLELMMDSSEPILFDLPSPMPEVKPPSVDQVVAFNGSSVSCCRKAICILEQSGIVCRCRISV